MGAREIESIFSRKEKKSTRGASRAPQGREQALYATRSSLKAGV